MRVVEGIGRSLEAARWSLVAVSALDDLFVATHLPAAQLERAGKMAEKLRNHGFVDAKVSQILRALFCNQLVGPREAEQQMERAFDVWDHSHRGLLELSEFSRDVSALLAGDLEPLERQALIDGLSADGSGGLEYEGFREVMRAIGTYGAERRNRMAALRSYGDDVGLARTALGATQAATLSRHELRVAGAVVRVLQREMYRAEDAAALLPALGLRSPTELQLRSAFGVFDLGSTGQVIVHMHAHMHAHIHMHTLASLTWGALAR
jgi:Ca2+-binding EF-hand superfamily protein